MSRNRVRSVESALTNYTRQRVKYIQNGNTGNEPNFDPFKREINMYIKELLQTSQRPGMIRRWWNTRNIRSERRRIFRGNQGPGPRPNGNGNQGPGPRPNGNGNQGPGPRPNGNRRNFRNKLLSMRNAAAKRAAAMRNAAAKRAAAMRNAAAKRAAAMRNAAAKRTAAMRNAAAKRAAAMRNAAKKRIAAMRNAAAKKNTAVINEAAKRENNVATPSQVKVNINRPPLLGGNKTPSGLGRKIPSQARNSNINKHFLSTYKSRFGRNKNFPLNYNNKKKQVIAELNRYPVWHFMRHGPTRNAIQVGRLIANKYTQ